jgi:cytochrome c oxidase assembly factor CtaG
MTLPGPSFERLLGSWSADPTVIAPLVIAAALYLLGAHRTRRRWSAWRTWSFLAGLVVLATALLSGVDGYGEELLSVHMAQHLLLILLAPALLLWGAPVRLAFASSPSSLRSNLARVLRHPAVRVLSMPPVGFVVFAAAVLVTHLTGVYELALRHETVHAFEHVLYLWAGLLFLAPLIAADPLPHPPGPVARFSWLMGAMAVMALPGALLTFSTRVRYPFYLTPARALGRSALADQHLAGAIMWVGGGIAMFALAMIVTMSGMLSEERHQRRRESHPRADERAGATAAEVLGA